MFLIFHSLHETVWVQRMRYASNGKTTKHILEEVFYFHISGNQPG